MSRAPALEIPDAPSLTAGPFILGHSWRLVDGPLGPRHHGSRNSEVNCQIPACHRAFMHFFHGNTFFCMVLKEVTMHDVAAFRRAIVTKT